MKSPQDEVDQGYVTCCAKSSMRMSNGDSALASGPLALLLHLKACQEAWSPGPPWNTDGARAALWGRPAGSFLVLRDSAAQPELLCVCVESASAPVKHFPIRHTGTVLQLTESHLSFPDLAQLVAFYTLSRDVLPVCLRVPEWISSLADPSEKQPSQLGPKSWLCPLSNSSSDSIMPESSVVPGAVLCTIQLTTASGALCIINPLYLHEHGDEWLSRAPDTAQLGGQPGKRRFERRLSRSRPWGGAGLVKNRGISLDEETLQNYSETGAGAGVGPPVTTSTGVVLRRASSSASSSDPFQRSSTGSAVLHSPAPQSPHRVSWVEDNMWASPPAPPFLLHPPSLELDSLSISSIEEETDSACSSPALSHHSRLPLANKVKHRLSAVGHAIGGLVNPQTRLTNRVQELSRSRSGTFAEALRGFVEQTQRSVVTDAVTSTDLLQEVRASLTGLRDTLLDYPDVCSLMDSMADQPDTELDAMLETSLHKVALKPVCSHLYSCIHAFHSSDGSFQKLQGNQRTLEGRSLEELEGTAGAGVPDPVTMEKIQQRWASMHKAYSPNKKVQILLKVCKTIYHSMSANAKPGVVFGADDFLPCLTWVLLRSDVVTLQVDTDYMMELLDPMQLQGEGGYYLTSVYSALFYITTFRPRLAARQLSVEAQQSLSQWHRRRTLHCNQSRRGSHRRTIRRHTSPKSLPKGTAGLEAERQDTLGPPAGSEETLQVINENVTIVDLCVKEQSGNHTQGPQPGHSQSAAPARGRASVACGTGSRTARLEGDTTQEPVGVTEGGQEASTRLLKGPEVLWSKVEEEEEDTEGESSSGAED
ncbi:ras and Rab interactor 3 isoform X2 [Sardina pilchardus]|uniref:ras and Rab interactor 3 isoform X2 n=1 Tax=Sardina pilchardus TaxID=27697 RepID=UPI002E0E1E4F